MNEMSVGSRGSRDRSLQMSGRPKDMKQTVLRLMRYLSHEKKLFILAMTCTVVYTAASLAVSYLLRPVINRFIY